MYSLDGAGSMSPKLAVDIAAALTANSNRNYTGLQVGESTPHAVYNTLMAVSQYNFDLAVLKACFPLTID